MLEQAHITDAMRRALALARRGPAADPNPQVGCVILDPEGLIVAEGWHRGAGTAHAEVHALARLPHEWRGRAAELTAVVTLEPCNHTGRTGPCAVALVEAGIGAVVYALSDSGEASGGGTETLRAAGVEVRGGVLAGEARALLEPWLARHARADAPGWARRAEERASAAREAAAAHLPRPRVTVKWAQTLDGRAAAADGSSQWITGPEARADVHRRRAEADAILVGTGTLLADDPSLTARTGDGAFLVPPVKQPIPVVLGHRPIPVDSRLRRHPALAANDLAAPIQLAGNDLDRDLAELHERGVRRLFVEGGPTVASAFIAAGLADELLVYVAPALLGGPRLALGDLGIARMRAIKRLRLAPAEPLGADLLFRARFKTGDADGAAPIDPTTPTEEET